MTTLNSQGFRSEIRESSIKDLLEKVTKRKYGKYLLRVRMQKLRGFEETSVTFDFPVTALVGPNGGQNHRTRCSRDCL